MEPAAQPLQPERRPADVDVAASAGAVVVALDPDDVAGSELQALAPGRRVRVAAGEFAVPLAQFAGAAVEDLDVRVPCGEHDQVLDLPRPPAP
ncbi:hypothetical protein [Streptomyces sp. NPDC017949]|uniref:hypothetical protein n=1 Tax=Streptomyces sp. NPDC017949 TaxID=3365020 RepID=UPI0037900050